MYKIIYILFFIGVLQSSIYAQTTREDVDKYLEVSRGGEIVKNTFLIRYKTYFSKMYGSELKKADKSMIKKYKDFIFNPKYEDVFYETFSQMDDNSFFEIMAFYETQLGQKYTQAFKELYEMDIGKKLMLSIIEKKDRLLLPKKRKLVTEINKVMYSKLYIDLENDIFIFGDSKAIEKYKISSNDNKNIDTNEKKLIIDEYIEVFNEFAYRNFSDEELSQLLKYAKTYGKIEMGILHTALKLNMKHFEKDLAVFLKEKMIKSKSKSLK